MLSPTSHTSISVGDTVRLVNSDKRYLVRQLFSFHAICEYSHGQVAGLQELLVIADLVKCDPLTAPAAPAPTRRA